MSAIDKTFRLTDQNGPRDVNGEALLSANEDDYALAAWLRVSRVGDTFHFGGAQAEITIRRTA